MLIKKETLARVNTRIRQNQQAYVKKIAKKNKLTEGEVFRAIIDEHMLINNK